MTLPRLCSRLEKLDVLRRPWVVADVLRRARQCAPSEVGAFLIAELTAVDPATVDAIMDQLTEAEGAALDALIGPELFAFLEMLPASELEAITKGDPGALQRSWRAFQRWRNGRA
jgi:hypothetical protein